MNKASHALADSNVSKSVDVLNVCSPNLPLALAGFRLKQVQFMPVQISSHQRING